MRDFSDLGPFFERFPLKESHFRGPQNAKIFRLRRALPPNRAILADILGYLTVFALEIADLGVRSQTTPPRADPSPRSEARKEGGVAQFYMS